jgi:hypothetical protein
MAESIANRKERKPAKPYPDFPLFSHASGRWAKKIRGKLHYFGKVSDGWEPALQRYQDERDDLMAGRVPRTRRDGLTVQDMVNKFLTAKLRQVEQRELQPATIHAYHKACAQITNAFGKTRRVEDLATEDLGVLRASLAKQLGVVGLTNAITG